MGRLRRLRTTGRPALSQAVAPPSICQASPAASCSRRSLLFLVRRPELQVKTTGLSVTGRKSCQRMTDRGAISAPSMRRDSTSSGSRMSTSRISPASSFLLTSWGLMRGSMIDSRICRARGPGHAALPLRTKGRTISWYCVPACRSSSCCCSFSGRCSCFCCDCFS